MLQCMSTCVLHRDCAAVRVTRCVVILFADGVYAMFQRVSKTRTPWCSMLALLGLMCIPTFVTAQELPSVVATVQGQPIAADDLTQALRGELLRLEMQRYQLFREKLDELIADKIFSLEAAQRGVSAQQFIAR